VANSEAPVPGSATILCIEDETEMIDLLRLMLEREGYRLIGAHGGEAGLERIREEHPDLVLLDLMMPGLDGWEVYRQLQTDPSLGEIPVIVVTAKAQEIDVVLGLRLARVADYIVKPFSAQQLVQSIRRVLGEGEAEGGRES
jgi:two-component system alkaline phosphatase synthesis response regulator PhoP